MSEPRAQVRNAASPKQVARAAARDRELEELARAAMANVMATPAGRIVMWDLLNRAGVYRSIFHPSSQIYYLAGRQDFGHELIALLTDVDEALYQLMEAEARARQKRDNARTDAIHTTSVTEGEQQNG